MVDSEKPRPDASFKIKDALQKIVQAKPVVSTEKEVEKVIQVEQRVKFDEDKLRMCLEKYLSEHTPEPMIAVALKAHKPELDGEKITLFVDNQLQLDKLEALKIHLRNGLARLLNNGFIVLSFKIFDANTAKEEKKLFTSSEKFEHFLKINPVVADLKTVFGLEIE